ncbi:class I SAM-dependent methyltransferase [Paucibacter soli]|uniref:class I SAM-dependent methyltransferase n=1 Tax=Paucibacter soli TaxID=3133433 RepID=UPI0030A0035E
MDHCQLSAATFDQLAERYRDKYMDLDLYDAGYARFGALLPAGPARVLDAACGPGNVAHYLLAQRPELELLGIDLAPRMVALAQAAVPSARFMVHDCRRMAELAGPFDGIVCAFGLPYLSAAEAAEFIAAAAAQLRPGGALYLSAMEGRPEDSGLETSSGSGAQAFVHYHEAAALQQALSANGLRLLELQRMPAPPGASKQTQDLILIASKA